VDILTEADCKRRVALTIANDNGVVAETTWPTAELAELTSAEELVLVLTRDGSESVRVPVWVVAIGDEVYLRSYKGVTSMWFRRVQADANQAIQLSSGQRLVRFENVERHDAINKSIDAEYNRKYARFDYVNAMSEPAAVDATLRMLPR
jgi:hypothetical protein